VRRLVSSVEYVFHLAVRNIIVSTKEPIKDFTTNVGGTINVLEACLAEKSHIKALGLYFICFSLWKCPLSTC